MGDILLSAGKALNAIDNLITLINDTRDRYDAAQADETYAESMIKTIENESRITVRKKYQKVSESLNEYLGALS